MKTNAKVIYASELILAVYLIWLKLNMGNVSNLLKNITALIVFSILMIILLAFFGIEKDKNYLKGSSARIVITGLMVFFLITYALGIILGFRRGFLYHDLFSFIKNIAFVLVITVEIEIKDEYKEETAEMKKEIENYNNPKKWWQNILIDAIIGAVVGGLAGLVLKVVKNKKENKKIENNDEKSSK